MKVVDLPPILDFTKEKLTLVELNAENVVFCSIKKKGHAEDDLGGEGQTTLSITY